MGATVSESLQLDHLVGNGHIKTFLNQIVRKQSIGNSLLFAGPPGVGKGLFAKVFAQALLKTDREHHPDLHLYRPEGKVGMHSIAAMRQLSEEVCYAPFQAPHKIFLIEDADRMLSASANALLKTFEEPSLDTIIILITSYPERLLPTIVSRCRTLRFHPVGVETLKEWLCEKHGLKEQIAASYAIESRGSVVEALKLTQEGPNPLKQQWLELLTTEAYRDYSKLLPTLQNITKELELQAKLLEDTSMQSFTEEMNALQKEAARKEIEATISLAQTQITHQLFETLLFWFRDLHLLTMGTPHSQVMLPTSLPDLLRVSQRGHIPPLNKVETLIREAKLSLSRSTSLPLVLEHLFLELSII